MAKHIGDTRTFEKYSGKWKITDIQENVNKVYELIFQKPEVVCPYCNKSYYHSKRYNIVHVETLECDGKTMHLGIGDQNNYVMLEEGKEIINGN